MDKELLTFFKDTFCNDLRAIRSDVESNGGMFRDGCQLDEALDCIRGLKNVLKLMADAK